MSAAQYINNFSVTDSESVYSPRQTPKKILKLKNVKGGNSSIRKPPKPKQRKRKIETALIKEPKSREYLPTTSESENDEENQPPLPSKKSKIQILNDEIIKNGIDHYPFKINFNFEDLVSKDQHLNPSLYGQQQQPEQQPSSFIQNVPSQLVDPYLSTAFNQKHDSIEDTLPRPRTPRTPDHFYSTEKPIAPVASKKIRMVSDSDSESDNEAFIRTKRHKPKVKTVARSCISDHESDVSCVSDMEIEKKTNGYKKREPKILECLAKENENEEPNQNNIKMGPPPPPLKLKIQHISSYIKDTGNESIRSESDADNSDDLEEKDEGMYLLFF